MNRAVTVYEALNRASSSLQEHGWEEEIARRLLQHHTGWSRTRLFAEMRTELDDEQLLAFEADVRRACSGVPVQHITGTEVFWDRDYAVSNEVLIPRQETEELVDAVFCAMKTMSPPPRHLVDIGTGSGIIAVTLYHLWHEYQLTSGDSRPFNVTATDVSDKALTKAEENASRHGADGITFLRGDALQPLIEAECAADVIISNPPYIPETERTAMKTNVTDHEPAGALFAGADGLSIYRRLIAQLPEVLSRPGLVAFEIGWNQGERVRELLLAEFPEADVTVQLDMNGKERIVLCRVPNT
ncbi:peptide chain release factor N(5)-glutamine methyltransferase [Salisediminibacterium halotolerans]|uniref:Release factor glutamine methyltransferase n=1 Tax=Salisediminibacterium halotolerans TaxID=517425 RepID=A0A1H9QTA6_9BACI|nr:peptide chain release factor N(5)-glutamine methyltransferase [Salisediminibacterium haloalkalitolerans]SER63089.1 release factor glutamine methyltransferase [Salisediminibacterium haloalkalitolerans]